MEDEKIVDINAKYVQTTLAYDLPHASKNIMKNKIEEVTEHDIMKRFFYVTFDSLNFALVAGISFFLCHLSVQLDPNSGGTKMFLSDVYIRPWWNKGLKHQRVYSSLVFKGLSRSKKK